MNRLKTEQFGSGRDTNGEAVKIIRSPQSQQDGVRIEQNAWNLIQAGAPWTLLDNSRDFVSRCYDGKPGSETRTLALGLGLVACVWPLDRSRAKDHGYQY